jgi:hypothetical protein
VRLVNKINAKKKKASLVFTHGDICNCGSRESNGDCRSSNTK